MSDRIGCSLLYSCRWKGKDFFLPCLWVFTSTQETKRTQKTLDLIVPTTVRDIIGKANSSKCFIVIPLITSDIAQAYLYKDFSNKDG